MKLREFGKGGRWKKGKSVSGVTQIRAMEGVEERGKKGRKSS